MEYSVKDLAKMIDFSLLTPTLTDEELEQGCRTALEYNVASVCIMPYYLPRCAQLLVGSTVQPGTTIGFPHGGHATTIKMAEAKLALEEGARELDWVVNSGKVRSGQGQYVRDEVAAVVDVVHQGGAKLKLIFENCYLDNAQKIRLCKLCGELGVDWAKTSTGYGVGAGTMEDFQLMLDHCPPPVQVKAAGGVPDLDTLLTIREMGVTRVGKRSVTLLEEAKHRLAQA